MSSLHTELFPFPEFRGGQAPILVATDVASRGLGELLLYINPRLPFRLNVWCTVSCLCVM